MSAEKTPTLAYSMIHFEMFMTRWEQLAETNSALKPYIDIGIEWATKYYQRMDNSRAYIICMSTLSYFQFCALL